MGAARIDSAVYSGTSDTRPMYRINFLFPPGGFLSDPPGPRVAIPRGLRQFFDQRRER